MGRLTCADDSEGNTIGYTYDEAGNVSVMRKFGYFGGIGSVNYPVPGTKSNDSGDATETVNYYDGEMY